MAPLTEDQVDELFLIWYATRSTKVVYTLGGIGEDTARIYVNHGYPHRGVMSFKERAIGFKLELEKMSKLDQVQFEGECMILRARAIFV